MASRSAAIEQAVHDALRIAIDPAGDLNGILPAVPELELTDEPGVNTMNKISLNRLVQVSPAGFSSRKLARGKTQREYGVQIVLLHKMVRVGSVIDRTISEPNKEFIEKLVTWVESEAQNKMSGSSFIGIEPAEMETILDESASKKGIFGNGIIARYTELLDH